MPHLKDELVSAAEALPGRDIPMSLPPGHYVSGRPLAEPYPEGMAWVEFGMGCFWGAERLFWQLPGVWVTAVGYAGGYTPNPSYEEVCSGCTGHTEVVRVVYAPEAIGFDALLQAFWQGHDPTQGMRQGNDRGSQYRSAIYTYDEGQQRQAELARDHYQARLSASGYGSITTELGPAGPFYFAEPYHQQYLAKNPGGYCGLGGTGVGY